MRKDLEAELRAEFPGIFRDMYGPPTETPMHWGCDCGDGWLSLIRQLCLRLDLYLKEHPELDFKFNQVKEKFGSLRIYSEGGDDRTRAFIDEVRAESVHVCEVCGQREGVTGVNVSTLCPVCRELRLQDQG